VALDAAVATHLSSVQTAYATRATELAGAYSNTTAKTLQVGVKTAWTDFNKSVKAATTAWRTAATPLGQPSKSGYCMQSSAGVSDSANSGSEVSGQ